MTHVIKCFGEVNKTYKIVGRFSFLRLLRSMVVTVYNYSKEDLNFRNSFITEDEVRFRVFGKVVVQDAAEYVLILLT